MRLFEGINFDKVAKRVFQILKSRQFSLKMFQEDGKPALDPEYEARMFFVEKEGLVVSIIRNGEKSELKVYISDESDLEKLAPVLSSLRNTANFFGLIYNILKFGEKLTPKNFKFAAYKNKREQEEEMAESTKSDIESKLDEAKDISNLWGSTKSSYQKVGEGPARMIVRHSSKVDEDQFAARSRNINKIFIENCDGERIKFPVNWLQGARAMTRHISEGGQWNDNIGKHIRSVSEEYRDLRSFAKHAGRNLNEDQSSVVESVKSRTKEIATEMKKIQGPASYRRFAEAFEPETDQINEINLSEEIDRLKEMFGDSECLESVAKTILKVQEDNHTPEQEIIAQFENWTKDYDPMKVLFEGDDDTWSWDDYHEQYPEKTKGLKVYVPEIDRSLVGNYNPNTERVSIRYQGKRRLGYVKNIDGVDTFVAIDKHEHPKPSTANPKPDEWKSSVDYDEDEVRGTKESIDRMRHLAGIKEDSPDFSEEQEIERQVQDKINDYMSTDGDYYVTQLTDEMDDEDKQNVFTDLFDEIKSTITSFIENEFGYMDIYDDSDIRNMIQDYFDENEIDLDVDSFVDVDDEDVGEAEFVDDEDEGYQELKKDLHSEPEIKSKFHDSPTKIIQKYVKKPE